MGRLWRWFKSIFTKVGRALRKAARLSKKLLRLLESVGLTLPDSLPVKIVQAVAVIGLNTKLARAMLRDVAGTIKRLIDKLPDGAEKDEAEAMLARVRAILNSL